MEIHSVSFYHAGQYLIRHSSHLPGLFNHVAWIRGYRYQAVAEENWLALGQQ